MYKIIERFMRSDWFAAFNFRDEESKARSCFLANYAIVSIRSYLSGGVFYSGFLLAYGINIVNISIITLIPYITSMVSLLSPRLTAKIRRRKKVILLFGTAGAFFSIFGITALPQLVHDPSLRIIGIISVSLVGGFFTNLFSPASQVWEMSHVTPDTRPIYISAINIVYNAVGITTSVLVSFFLDRLFGQARLNCLIAMRCLAAILVFVSLIPLRIPGEPEYRETSEHRSISDVIRIPLSHSKFRLTMLIYFLYNYIICICESVINTWRIATIQCSYLYINAIDGVAWIALIITTPLWKRISRHMGVYHTLLIMITLYIPTYVMYSFVTHDNYRWLMTIVRLSQHLLWAAQLSSAGSLIYVSLPPDDQTCCLTFYSLSTSISRLLAMLTGTMIVAKVGENAVIMLGHSFTSVPLLLLLQAALLILLLIFIASVIKKLEPQPPLAEKA